MIKFLYLQLIKQLGLATSLQQNNVYDACQENYSLAQFFPMLFRLWLLISPFMPVIIQYCILPVSCRVETVDFQEHEPQPMCIVDKTPTKLRFSMKQNLKICENIHPRECLQLLFTAIKL